MQNKLDKIKFYEQLKKFNNKYIPIFIMMPINLNSKYSIILDENRIENKITHNYTLQIFDRTKTGYEKYLCNDIEFNLIDENIKTDYQLYKFICKKIGGVLSERNSIEEDIKNINKGLYELADSYELYHASWAKRIFESIKEKLNHILSDYKRVLKENEELKADNYELNNRINDLLDNIPVQKVKDKIEEYKKMLLSCNRFSDVDRIRAINERILELQELIESEEK
nr:MAG TPA: hypothetical protein [Caudoviricetes sp.]DAV87203.1 MAG TPA: hypothetical protein [Caudoviricetes sp.]